MPLSCPYNGRRPPPTTADASLARAVRPRPCFAASRSAAAPIAEIVFQHRGSSPAVERKREKAEVAEEMRPQRRGSGDADGAAGPAVGRNGAEQEGGCAKERGWRME